MVINIQLGDSTRLIQEIPDKSFDYTFTSPPYNRKRNDKYQHFNDNEIPDYFMWSKLMIDQCLRVSRKLVFWNIQTNYYNRSDVYKLFGEYAHRIREVFVWEKTNPLPASGYSITNSLEYFICLSDSEHKVLSNKTYTKNIISTSVNSNMPKNHKAVMKQEVSDHFIGLFTKESESVLDPFMGIGTTGVSCKKLNRAFHGIEMVSDYFNTAKVRIEGAGDYYT